MAAVVGAVPWLLAYLLVGFVLHFVGSQCLRLPPAASSWWELAAVTLWPLTIIAVLALRIAVVHRWLRRRAGRRGWSI